MTLPAPSPGEPAAGEPVLEADAGDQPESSVRPARRRPRGALVVTIATLIVVGVAVAEALLQGRVGWWAGAALVTVSVVAAAVTRPGDRSLPAMMPPLAFLAAVVIAGQVLLPDKPESLLAREGLVILQALGANAVWVVAATALALLIAGGRHLHDRRRLSRA